PSIRKHGLYATPEKLEEMLSDPDSWIKTLQALKAEREKRIELEAKVEQDAPKVLFADSVAASETSILIGDLAKLIKQNGIDIGQNKLFEFLRNEGWLISRKGSSYNMPSQKGMECGYFEIKERTVDNPDGSIRVTRTPKVTGKGQIYFVELFLKRGSNFELAI
ncbi:MAG: phage antirepressor KilAC domain-containing protein, partial [Synergistaceae bacterium]|nr:phage antirepressor KilAC domain-containing protein [Synergistaceae bacterium]